MRIAVFTLVSIIITNISFAQKLNDIRINEDFEDQSLKEICTILKEKYSIQLAYDVKMAEALILSKKIHNKTPHETFELLLKGSLISFRVHQNQILLFEFQQQKTEVIKKQATLYYITGIIKDKRTSDVLPFANIAITNTNKGTFTNVYGQFSLIKLQHDSIHVIVQHIGYKPKELKISTKNNTFIEIYLEPFDYGIKEVTVNSNANLFIKTQNLDGAHTKVNPKFFSLVPNYGGNDVFKAIQLLPGISGTNENAANLQIHGGSSEHNLILFDGFTVYHTDHFYGKFSAFNHSTIKDVKVFKTGFGAQYGQRVSSVVDITGKSGNFNKVSGSFNANLISAGITLEIPLLKHKGSLFIAARRSFTDLFQSYLYKQMYRQLQSSSYITSYDSTAYFMEEQEDPEFYFYDLNAKLTLKPNNKDVISFSFYNGFDSFSTRYKSSFTDMDSTVYLAENYDTQTQWGNMGTSLKWSRKWTPFFNTSSYLAYSNYISKHLNLWDYYYFSEADNDYPEYEYSEYFGETQNNSISELTLKSSFSYKLSNDNKIEGGMEYNLRSIIYDYIMDDELYYEYGIEKSKNLSLYLTNQWNINNKLQLNTGLRSVYYNISNQTYFEPRFSVAYNISKNVQLNAAAGKYTQFVNRVVFNDIINNSNDFWYIANNQDVPVLEAYHLITGVQINYKKLNLSVDVFRKEIAGVSKYNLQYIDYIFESSDDSLSIPDVTTSELTDNVFQSREEYITGIDLSLVYNSQYWTSLSSYSFINKTVYDSSNSQHLNYLTDYQNKHEFKLVNFMNLRQWNFSVTWIYALGKPMLGTPNYSINLSNTQQITTVEPDALELSKMLQYKRLDVSLSKTLVTKHAKYQLGFSILNLYNHKNINLFQYAPENLQDIIQDQSTTYGNANQLTQFTPTIFANVRF